METTHTKEYPKLRWYEDMRRWRKFELGLGIIAVLALGAAVWGNYQAKDGLEIAQAGLEQARKEAEESRIVNAWQILSNRSPGNTGKKAALETLHNAKENLQGIDLSCETMGGMDEKNESCDTPTFLANVSLPNADLSQANLSDADLTWANLSDADLRIANLSDAYLGGANLSDAYLRGANLSNAGLWRANLSDADLTSSNLSDADLSGTNLSDADLTWANLSNVYFCSLNVYCAENLTQAQIDKAWAWADSPQVFKARHRQLDLAPPPLCPVELRPEYEANEETGIPDGC